MAPVAAPVPLAQTRRRRSRPRQHQWLLPLLVMAVAAAATTTARWKRGITRRPGSAWGRESRGYGATMTSCTAEQSKAKQTCLDRRTDRMALGEEFDTLLFVHGIGVAHVHSIDALRMLVLAACSSIGSRCVLLPRMAGAFASLLPWWCSTPLQPQWPRKCVVCGVGGVPQGVSSTSQRPGPLLEPRRLSLFLPSVFPPLWDHEEPSVADPEQREIPTWGVWLAASHHLCMLSTDHGRPLRYSQANTLCVWELNTGLRSPSITSPREHSWLLSK